MRTTLDIVHLYYKSLESEFFDYPMRIRIDTEFTKYTFLRKMTKFEQFQHYEF